MHAFGIPVGALVAYQAVASHKPMMAFAIAVLFRIEGTMASFLIPGPVLADRAEHGRGLQPDGVLRVGARMMEGEGPPRTSEAGRERR